VHQGHHGGGGFSGGGLPLPAESAKPRIISVSRRSDIPAYYGEWFLKAVEAGGAEVPHPFSREKHFVPLAPQETAALVFWSKDFRPFIGRLAELEQQGFGNFIFNFTITGLPQIFEPQAPPLEQALADFKLLSSHYGRKVMFWRFDPIIFSEITGEEHYINRFRGLAEELAPYAGRCIFSFAYFYRKVERALTVLKRETGVAAWEPEVARKRELAAHLAEIAGECGLSFEACCCGYLLKVPGVKQSHYVDGELVRELQEGKYQYALHPSREGCGCAESFDIGRYGSCKGGCVYCYAR